MAKKKPLSITLRDLGAAIARNEGIPKTHVMRVLRAQSEVVQNALIEGERVRIPGLGTAFTRNVAAVKRHNPSTLAPVHKDARRKVRVSVSKQLRTLHPSDKEGVENRAIG